jgi:hypothetical protein
MTLPHDTARCHDSRCPQRQSCLRWLERNSPGERISHHPSLRPFSPFADSCANHIPLTPVE